MSLLFKLMSYNYNIIFAVETPLLQLQCCALASFMLNVTNVENTIVNEIVKLGFSPMKVAFNKIFPSPMLMVVSITHFISCCIMIILRSHRLWNILLQIYLPGLFIDIM